MKAEAQATLFVESLLNDEGAARSGGLAVGVRELYRKKRGIYSGSCADEVRAREEFMRSKYLRICVAAGLGVVGASWGTGVRAQAPAGPLPQGPAPEARPQAQSAPVKPRTSILGAWKINPDESEDARKKMQDARGADSGRGGGGRGGVRMGIPGMGGGPYGGRRGGGGESDQDRQKMQEVLTPSRALTVAEAKKDVEIDVFDDQERKSALFTDGRKVQKSKDNTTQEISAHWDGNRLVTDEKTPSGKKMSRTYELSYDGTQLYETVQFTRGRSNSSMSVRYVYDEADAPKAAGAQSRQ
jgi:hypothetical protein